MTALILPLSLHLKPPQVKPLKKKRGQVDALTIFQNILTTQDGKCVDLTPSNADLLVRCKYRGRQREYVVSEEN